MEYMLIIYDNEKAWEKFSEGDRGAMMKRYGDFTNEILKSGHMKSGAPLKAANTAVTIRKREGKTLRTDGPFAETREQLAGFYIVEAKNLEEACAIAARIPSVDIGSIEVREVQKM